MLKCKECSFYKQSCKGFIESNFTSGRGPKSSEVMVVFDSLFMGDLQSERLASDKEYNNYLNRYLQQIGLDLNSVYITSLIKCYISDKKKKPTKTMKQKCVDLYLDKEIREIKPKVIILMGRMSTSWFIPSVNARMPLKQVIGESFYSGDYNCNVVPVYDMFYLTNFTHKSSQIRQTEKAFAKVNSLLNSEIVKKQQRIEYSSKLEDLETLGDYITSDVEATGLDPRVDKVLTIAITDVKTKKTVSFDAEDYGAIEKCTHCDNGQIENKIKTEELAKLNKIKEEKPNLKSTDARIARINLLSDTIDCPLCRGNGKILKKDLKNNKFYKEILPACGRAISKRKVIFHNAVYDLQMLYAHGLDLFDSLISDTRMMQFLTNPLGGNSLGFLIELYFGIPYKEEIDRKHILKMPMEERRYYCAEDTFYTASIFTKLYKDLKEQGSLNSNQIMTNMIKVIASDLEYYGIAIDTKLADEIIDFYQAEKDKLELKFKKKFNLPDEFNLNSPTQLCKLLYEDLNLPILVRTKTKDKKTGEFNPSTNEEAIRKLASKRPTLRTLVEYRTVKGHVEKLKGYKEAVASDGRIHGTFNLFSPDSSRVMNAKPNYQNVPRLSRIKEIFKPKPGYTYLYYDYSAIEFRIWLALSNDKKGIEFVNNDRDIHAFIASEHHREPEEKFLKAHRKANPEYDEMRNCVKAIVYGSMYGRTPEGIVAEHGGSLEEAAQIQTIFFNLCREGWMWLQQIENKVFSEKKLFTPFGTPRMFPDIELAQGPEREKIIRESKSFIVQSWAVEMVFIGMYKVWKAIREMGIDAHYVHQIHDGNIIEVKTAQLEVMKKIIAEHAQSPYKPLKIPLTAEVKVGESWDAVA